MTATDTLPLTKTTSFAHQTEAIQRSKDARYFGLFMEQGTGKTHVTIATIVHLYRKNLIDGVLILAPNGVHDNWHRNELPIHCPLNDDMLTGIWHGSDGARKRAAWDYVSGYAEKDKLVVLMANIEAVRTDAFMKSIEHFTRNRRFMLVVDESTCVKNPKAQQTKAVFKIAKNAAYTRILTGTPITQSPLDLWAQCRVLDEIALPYPSYTAFKREFAIEQVLTFGHRSFNKIVGYQNQAQLAQLIKPFTIRVLKSECLDLPPKVYQTRYVELTPEQKRIYKQLMEQCLATLTPGMVTVTTAITMLLRLQQVTLGYVQPDEGPLVQIPHNRIKILEELLYENPGKAIIFVRFVEDIHQITEVLRSLNKRFVCYYGDVSSTDRHSAVENFQNSEFDYFIATSAASKGLSLTAAEHVIYYSQSYSLETRLQSEDRAHRIGQTKTVVYTDLVAKGTVDDRIVAALQQKKQLADAIIDRDQLRQLLTLEE